MADRRWMCVWALTVLCLGGACGADAAMDVDTTPTRILGYDLESDEPAGLLVDGVSIEVGSALKKSLSWQAQSRSRDGSTSTNFLIITHDDIPLEERESEGDKVWIGTLRLAAEDGALRLGDTSYGDVTTTDTVRIETTGVFVNEQLVGALPETLTEAVSEDG